VTSEESRIIREDIGLKLMSALANCGCANPLVQTRLTDTDPEPEPGPYVDVAVAARIRVADYNEMKKVWK
jgi:hypothetical protein